MNYIITGSIGHISKPIVLKLIAAEHSVIVVTSSAEVQTRKKTSKPLALKL